MQSSSVAQNRPPVRRRNAGDGLEGVKAADALSRGINYEPPKDQSDPEPVSPMFSYGPVN